MILKIHYSEKYINGEYIRNLIWIKDVTNKKIKQKWDLSYKGFEKIYYKPDYRSFSGTSYCSYLFDTKFTGKKFKEYENLEKIAYHIYRNIKIDDILA